MIKLDFFLKQVCCQRDLLFGGLKEHGNLSFDVGLSEDSFHFRPVFRFLTQHALDQVSQLGIIFAGHLWQLTRNEMCEPFTSNQIIVNQCCCK